MTTISVVSASTEDDEERAGAPMTIRNWCRRSVTRTHAVTVAVYLSMAFLLLYPILASPVVADDYANPFIQFDENGPGLGAALRYGWTGATEGASFRIFGNLVGAGYNWLWMTVSADLGVSMTTIYSATKFVVLVLVALAIARVWYVTSATFGRSTSYRTTVVLSSLVLFSTLQLHASWSNDPVGNYPLSGFGSATVGLLVIGAAVRAVGRPSWRSTSWATVAALSAVLYYEANIGAVIGAGIVIGVAAVRAWRLDRRASAWWPLLRSGVIVTGVPAALLLYGRTVTGGRADSYGGTTVRLSGALRALAVGVAGSIPGSAWRLARQALGGEIKVVYTACAVVALTAWVVRWWWTFSAESKPADECMASPRVDRTGVLSVAAACVVFAGFALALQASTIKVQDESPSVGYVYTAYAFGASVCALALGTGALAVLRRRSWSRMRWPIALLATLFLVVQSNVNWRLSEHLNRGVVPSRVLLAAFDDDVDAGHRCEALFTWRAGDWPGYYEDGVTDGIQAAFASYFGEPFCDGLTTS